MPKRLSSRLPALGLSLFSLLLPVHSLADDDGAWQIVLGNWDSSPSGTVTDEGSAGSGPVTYDVRDDLSMSDHSGQYLRVAWEQKGSNRSNVAFLHYQIDGQGSCEANATSRECGSASGGGLFGIGGGATSTRVTAHAQASAPTLIWWSRWGSQKLALDLGLSLSWVDGEVISKTENDSDSKDEFNSVIPALFAGLNYYPLESLRLRVSGNGISAGDNGLMVLEVSLGWTALNAGRFGLGLELGHRSMDIEASNDDNGDKADIRFDGSYLAALFSF